MTGGTVITGFIGKNLSKMKKITTVICALAFMISGITMAISTTEKTLNSYKTISAAQPMTLPQLPLNFQPMESKNNVDTVYRDTGRVDTIYKYKTKYVKVRRPTHTTDVPSTPAIPDRLVQDTVSNKMTLGREEQPKDAVDTSKVSIKLIVDDEVVYKR